jgi:plastocyanin
MRRFTPVVAAAAIAAIQAACSGSGSEPLAPPNVPSAEHEHLPPEVKRVEIHDECEPHSFNEALGRGTCERRGTVKFAQFIEQLTKTKVAPAWRFSPLNLDIKLGQSFSAFNVGGETHTFTEVEEYGGGIVPLLNQLSGNPDVAPECAALAPTDFVPKGGSTPPDTPEEAGVEKYQCCIHPWMRMTVTIHGA